MSGGRTVLIINEIVSFALLIGRKTLFTSEKLLFTFRLTDIAENAVFFS